MDALQVSEAAKAELLHCIGEKNLHGVREIARRESADEAALAKLCTLIGYDLPLAAGLSALRADLPEYGAQFALLETLCRTLGVRAEKVHLDFSVVNDMSYYNGIVFKGFVNGVPVSVLSGGRYDTLMHKMGKRQGAIGFAVYMDELQRLLDVPPRYDVDTVLLYGADADARALRAAVADLVAQGVSVSAMQALPEKLQYRRLLRLVGEEVEIVEDRA
jgi:ATP phosphoribosyltransferase regulatory subunit